MMRLTFARQLAGSTAAVLLSAQSPAFAGAPASRLPILLDCGTQADRAFCRALHLAVAETWPDHEVRPLEDTADGWRLFFVEQDDSGDDIAGHLVWRDATGAARRGPDLALSVMDGPVRAAAYRQFARDLIRISPLPF